MRKIFGDQVFDGKNFFDHGFVSFFKPLYADFLPDGWKNVTPQKLQAGHGGMDYFMLKDFFDAVLSARPFPLDVYDAAAWMSVTALSERSVAEGGAPVAVPDFTDGQWRCRPRPDVLI